MKKGYIKRGNIIVTMTGDVCCTNEHCPYIDDIGVCTNINAKCEYEKERFDALLHYGFADNKTVTMELRYRNTRFLHQDKNWTITTTIYKNLYSRYKCPIFKKQTNTKTDISFV